MKNKGVIIAIILILIMGVGVTVGTRRFIIDKTSGSSAPVMQGQLPPAEEKSMESMIASAGGGLMPSPERKNVPETASVSLRSEESTEGNSPSADSALPVPAEAESVPEEAGSEETPKEGNIAEGIQENHADDESAVINSESANEEAPVSAPLRADTVISPLSGSSDAALIVEFTSTLEDYQKKLKEIDALIKNTKDAEVNSSTDSYKNIADYEYRLWDTELNLIYQSVMSGMNEEEAKNLRNEEREWIRQRDLSAKKAASKYGGGTMESLEYTASLADSTRTRAYKLLEDYGSYLPQGEE